MYAIRSYYVLYLAVLLRWLSGAENDLHAAFDTMLRLYLGGLQA